MTEKRQYGGESHRQQSRSEQDYSEEEEEEEEPRINPVDGLYSPEQIENFGNDLRRKKCHILDCVLDTFPEHLKTKAKSMCDTLKCKDRLFILPSHEIVIDGEIDRGSNIRDYIMDSLIEPSVPGTPKFTMLEKENKRLKRNLAYYEKALARARGVSRCRKFKSIVDGTVDCCDFSDDTNSDESDGDDDSDGSKEDDGEYEDDKDEEDDTEEDDEEEYEEDDEPSRKRKKNWLIANIYIQTTFKYTTCTLTLSLFVWKSKEIDTEKFICKKCSFTTENLEKLNTHTKKIHVIHNVGKAPVEKPRTTSQTGFHTKETFDEIIDEMESRDPPVNIRIVISAIITKPSETKRRKKKTAKHSFEFMILDMTEASA